LRRRGCRLCGRHSGGVTTCKSDQSRVVDLIALGNLKSVVACVVERLLGDPGVATIHSVVFETSVQVESLARTVSKLTGQSRYVRQVFWVTLSECDRCWLVLVSAWLDSHYMSRLLPEPGFAQCIELLLVDLQ
jgi:hypothetical protein